MADELPLEGNYHDTADQWWAEVKPNLDWQSPDLWWDASKEELIKRLLDLWHR